MKSSLIALTIAMTMTANSMAFAASAAAIDTKSDIKIDESLIEQSLAGENKKMQETIAQVDALIKAIEQYRDGAANNKQSSFVTSARLMITLLGLSAGFVHLKNRQAESSISLTLAAVAGALSVLLEKYASGQRIDIMDIQKELAKNQKLIADELHVSAGLTKKDAALIAETVAHIGDINNEIQDTAGEIQKHIDNGQMDVAIVSIVTLVMHYAAPFLPAKVKDAVAGKAPNALAAIGQTKKQGQQVLGATNVGTLFSTLIGMGGKNSQQQMNTVLTNLYNTRSKLVVEASK